MAKAGGETPRARVLRAALDSLRAEAGAVAGPVRVTVECPGSRLVFELSAEECRSLNGPPDGLSPLEAATLRVLTPEPQTAKALARLAGYRLNSHFRAGLRLLERRGLAVRTGDGYRLAD